MTKARLIITIAVCGAILMLTGIIVVGTGGVRIDMLDVGQGDGILVTDGSRQLLVDAGPDGSALARLGMAMPLRDRTIEYALITHPHRDHYGGFRWILERYHVGTLFVADFLNEPQAYKDVLATVEARGGKVVHVAAGDRIDIGEHLEGDVLWPEKGAKTQNPNESSIVIAVHEKGRSGPAFALLTGDATEVVETALVKKDAAALRAYLLKAGHHGSKTSSSAPFLEAVGAKDAAVSVGVKNDYGHPSPSVIRRLTAYGYRIWRTDLLGSIRFVPTAAGVVGMTCRVFCLP